MEFLHQIQPQLARLQASPNFGQCGGLLDYDNKFKDYSREYILENILDSCY